MDFLSHGAFTAFLQVIGIDLVLAGDNAIVIGMAAAGLPKEQRAKAIFVGIIVATVLRIGFALVATQLLAGHRVCCLPAGSCCSGSAGRCGAKSGRPPHAER